MGEVLIIRGEVYSSKNHRRNFVHPYTGKMVSIKSKECLAAEEDIIVQLVKQRTKWFSMIEGEKPPLRVVLTMYRKTHRTFDFNNITQSLADCMVKAEYIGSDDAKTIGFYPPLTGDIHRVDKQNPRTEISLLDYSPF